MISYNFVKNANKDQLSNEISASAIGAILDSISISGTLIQINFKKNLSSRDFGTLYQVIQNHTPPDLKELQAQAKVQSAIDFGRNLLVEIAADNILLQLTSSQIITILTKYGGIKAMLETGSLKTALLAMQSIKPDDVISQERINKYINKTKAYLGM